MLTVRIPDDLRDAIDAVRGDVPRERIVRNVLRGWVEEEEARLLGQGRALESVLSGEPKVQAQGPKESPDSGAVAPRSSAPTRPSGHPQRCPKCGGLHKGDCPAHPRAGR